MKWNESLMLRGLLFLRACVCVCVCPEVFCCPFIFDYKNALPWHDASFPICHYSRHAPLPLALYFRICPWARPGGHSRTILWSKCVHRSVSLNQPKPRRCSQGCLFTFYTLWARNNCGSRRAHLAFRSVIWIGGVWRGEREREGEGERVSLSQLKPSPPKKHALNRKRIFSKNVQFAELAGKKEKKKKDLVSLRCVNCSKRGSHSAPYSDRCLAYIFYELISIRCGIYEMGLH